MSIFQRDPRAGIFLGGERVSGQEIRDQNGIFPSSFSQMLLSNRPIAARGKRELGQRKLMRGRRVCLTTQSLPRNRSRIS